MKRWQATSILLETIDSDIYAVFSQTLPSSENQVVMVFVYEKHGSKIK